MEDTQTLEAPLPESESKSAGDKAQTLETLLAEGERLLGEGDKTRALSRFQAATQLDSKSAGAWLGLGKATDDEDEAIQAFGRAIALNPDNIEARNRRLALQVGNLREGLDASERAYHEHPLRRFGRPLGIAAALLVLVGIVLLGKDPLVRWLDERALAANASAPAPTLAALALPPTWTPTRTFTPSPTPAATKTPAATATPQFVSGKINGTVTMRSGPGTVFPALGTLDEPTAVILVAVSPDGKYYQLHRATDNTLVWVSVAFVTVTGGDPSNLPVVSVPTLTPVPAPRPVYRPPTPAPAPAYSFSKSKFVPDPFGQRCDRWYIHGTVWNDWRLEPQGGIQGLLVRVWVNGAIYGTDTTSTHGSGNFSPGYWQVDFPANQAVNGLVAVVDSNGNLISPQYPFSLTSDCRGTGSTTEIIIDFSH